jgi:hypothetical protein
LRGSSGVYNAELCVISPTTRILGLSTRRYVNPSPIQSVNSSNRTLQQHCRRACARCSATPLQSKAAVPSLPSQIRKCHPSLLKSLFKLVEWNLAELVSRVGWISTSATARRSQLARIKVRWWLLVLLRNCDRFSRKSAISLNL